MHPYHVHSMSTNQQYDRLKNKVVFGFNFIVREPVIKKMEVALALWIEDRNHKRVPLSGPMVREKEKRLYAHFKEPGGSGECTDR